MRVGARDAEDRPAIELEMVPVPGTQVEMARCETTFRLWKQVRDWGAAHGYETDCDGDMGSLDYWGFDPVAGAAHPPQTHGSDEPVTDITVYDMAVWCNALSEMLGRKAVYHADSQCRTIYRQALKYRPIQFHFPEDYLAKYGQPEHSGTPPVAMGAGASQALPGVYAADAMQRVLPPLYLDERADGFRLPTIEEYQQAVAPEGQKYPWGDDPTGVFQHAWLFDTAGGTTHAVGRKQPTGWGLFDLLGNVSELSNPDSPTRMRTVRLGGSILDLTVGLNRGLLSSDAPPPTWPYCDTGFRVVRQLPEQVPFRRASLRIAAPPEDKLVLRFDPQDFDPLQGQVHRGNLHRDGVFQVAEITRIQGVKWRFRTGGPVKSSPVVVDGLVHVGSNDGHIYALDAETGEEVWNVETDGAVAGSAAVVDGVVYLASEDGRMFALDARTGVPRWVTRFSRLRPCGSPAVAYGVVFIGEGAKGGHDTGVMTGGPVVGLDANSGEIVWRGPPGPQGYAAICLDETRLFAGSNGSNFAAVDLATASSLWSRDGGHQNRQFMSFARSGDFAYVPGSMTGTVMAWDPSRGRTLWHVPIWPEQQLPINNGGSPGYEIYADLAVAHGRVYAGSNDGKLQTFAAETGERGWVFDAGSPIQSSPSIAGRTIYFGCWDGYLVAVDAVTGQLRWRHKPSSLPAPGWTVGGNEPSARIISSPWPADRAIYVGCDDGCVYALEGE
jgi:outer membrane protein assembly factor BamB